MKAVFHTLRHWTRGVRLYIALGSLIVTATVLWWTNSQYAGTPLYGIRTEEIFAWTATGLIAVAVAIGPVFKLFPRLPGKSVWFDARRLLGVSAAWFAALHAGIAYFGQFNGANPLRLPDEYQWAFLFGAVALIILLAMAGTSFDAAFRRMGKWWFRLHRLVYIAVIAILIHLFMIGVHASQPGVILTLGIGAGAVLTCHLALLIRNRSASRWQFITVIAMTVLLAGSFAYGLQQYHGSKNENGRTAVMGTL